MKIPEELLDKDVLVYFVNDGGYLKGKLVRPSGLNDSRYMFYPAFSISTIIVYDNEIEKVLPII